MGQTLGGLVVHSGHLPLSPLRVFASRFGQNEGFGIIAEEGGLVLDEHKKEDGNTGETAGHVFFLSVSHYFGLCSTYV